MRTEDLIAILADGIGAADRGAVRRGFAMAMLIGAAFAGIVAIGLLGMRPDLGTAHASAFLFAKLVFAGVVFALAALYLARTARPGGERRVSLVLMAAPFIAILAVAATILALAPASHWDRMVLGNAWVECLVSIPLIAIVPFAAAIWATRRAAPTDLVGAGAFAGLAAGSISAMAYALHCTDDSLPFVAVWYGGTLTLCTLAGALCGPRLLRW